MAHNVTALSKAPNLYHMKLTLPKYLYKYINPESLEHEARLAIVWRMYLNRRNHLVGNESELEHLNRVVLGEIFNVPSENWSRLSSRAPDPIKTVVRQMRSLAKSLQKKLPNKNHKVKRKKKKKAVTERVIVRRCSQTDADGTYPIEIINRPVIK